MPPTGATRPTSLVAGSSTGLIGAIGAAGARSGADGDAFRGRCEVTGRWAAASTGMSTDTGVFRRTRPSRGATTGLGSATACVRTGSGAAGAGSAGVSARNSAGSSAAVPGVIGVGLSREALSVASEPSPTCVAPTNTEPQASNVPAARPEARPNRIARPPTIRSPAALPVTETGVPAGSSRADRAPPTHAISAVAEGPEPNFLRRRAVIARHQEPPQGSGTGEEYRFQVVCPDPSLHRRSRVKHRTGAHGHTSLLPASPLLRVAG